MGRRELSLAVGAASVVAYNWWAAVPFHHGLLSSTDGLFSDLEVPGQRDASIMYHLDLAAGLLLLVALLLSGNADRRRTRLEHGALIGFALAGAVGGEFRYACAEGVNATCRHLEWHLQLPFHHYIHVLSGVAEFTTIPLALHQARRRTEQEGSLAGQAYRVLWDVLMVAYALLVVAYLTDRLGAFIEPISFVTFSAVVMTELLEHGPGPATSARSSRSPLRSRRGHDAPGSPPGPHPEDARSLRHDGRPG